VMASISDRATVERIIQAGATDILNKPVDLKDLLAKTNAVMGR
jgi:DNA-binding response OmpR family regulator